TPATPSQSQYLEHVILRARGLSLLQPANRSVHCSSVIGLMALWRIGQERPDRRGCNLQIACLKGRPHRPAHEPAIPRLAVLGIDEMRRSIPKHATLWVSNAFIGAIRD